jgi:hypothetical protein
MFFSGFLAHFREGSLPHFKTPAPADASGLVQRAPGQLTIRLDRTQSTAAPLSRPRRARNSGALTAATRDTYKL